MFPGVREDTFIRLLLYIYTDDIPFISPSRCIDLVELANRLCLPRLVNLVEQRVVEEMTSSTIGQENKDNNDVLEHCLKLLEPCKVSCKKDLLYLKKEVPHFEVLVVLPYECCMEYNLSAPMEQFFTHSCQNFCFS